MDPIQTLISQGYPPDVAKKMVESGMFDKMNNPLPTLPNLTGGIGTGVNTGIGAGEQIPPELQQYIDQGYNLEEARQLHASRNPNINKEDSSTDLNQKLLKTIETAVPDNIQQGDQLDFGSMLDTAGSGVSLEKAANVLGQSIGAEKGPDKTLGIIGGTGKLAFGLGRSIAGGIGQAKKNRYVQDYYEDLEAESLRDNYTLAPQTGSVNYLGGNSYGEDGGIKGKTLPLKEFLKSGGFKKKGFKKLM